MKKQIHIFICILLVFVLSILSSCGQATPPVQSNDATTTTAAATATTAGTTTAAAADAGTGATTAAAVTTTAAAPTTQAATTAAAKEAFEKPTKLTYWATIDSRMVKFSETKSTAPTFVEYTKRTGVEVEYIHPPQGMADEQFMVLISSKDLPDIIEYNWFGKYPGGPARAISDGVIIDLTPYWIPEICPNILAVLDKYEEDFHLSKEIKTIRGEYYVFPCIRGGIINQVNNGLSMRNDWLNELGISLPQTLDEVYDALNAFKDEKGCSAPLTTSLAYLKDSNVFVGAFGMSNSYYIDTQDVIRYGPCEPDYINYLEFMAKLYSEKLIDQDFSTNNDDNIIKNVTTGASGSLIGQNDSPNGMILAAMVDIDPSYDPVGLPYPKLNASDPKPRIYKTDYFYTTDGSAAITTSCKNPAGAAWSLDYWYGDDGYVLGNLGIEGESFYYGSDGQAYFTDLITNNPDGATLKEMVVLWSRAAASAPLVRNVRVVDLQRADHRIIDMTNTWSDVPDRSFIVPQLIYTEEENTKLSKLKTDISSYFDEMYLKFIMGRSSLATEYDTYVQTIKDIGIEEVLEIYNTAYERFKNS